MISTANVQRKIQDIPSPWIFQYYCQINEHLAGQELKITSVFKPTERTPSMVLYWDETGSRYKFNDFSTGRKGDAIDLVKLLYGLDNKDATIRILNDYQNFVNNRGQFSSGEIKISQKYKVTEHSVRFWDSNDAKFWPQFNIGSNLLDYYNVRPLQQYIMTKPDDGHQIIISKPYIYGYFKADGTLYKIYQPYNKDRKFIKVVSGYVQGSEQHGKDNPYLLLTSSLKDTMGIRSLGLERLDMDSPDSENNMLDELYIQTAKAKYKQILTLFDSDSAGIDAMKSYEEKYGFTPVYFTMAKDPTDGIKKYGALPVRDNLVIKINSKLI
jgi:hypothetical protein